MRTFALALALTQVQAAIPGTDLASCEAFAAEFDNTCTDPITYDMASDAGVQVSCISREVNGVLQSIHCPDGQDTTFDASNPCTWNRKLCVSCYTDATTNSVMVNVKSNGLPSHCINSIVNNAVAMEHEWNVRWQPASSSSPNYSAEDFNTSAKTDELLCDLQRTSSSNMAASSMYELDPARRMLSSHPPPNGGDGSGPPPTGGDGTGGTSGGTSGGSAPEALGTAAGIALSGGYIFNALAGGNIDAVENEGFTLDVCLSHPTPSSEFHYHYWTPCAKTGFSLHDEDVAPQLCEDHATCVSNPYDMVMNDTVNEQPLLYTPARWDKPIGLARDGHLIMGPYKNAEGDEWQCEDRDQCNGSFIDGQYVYVGSNEFPYVVGCWGPGPEIEFSPTCTLNGCGSTSSSSTPGTTNDNGEDTTDDGAIEQIVASFSAAAMAAAALSF